jgi:tetratricopeptide (TPR) repeat protein
MQEAARAYRAGAHDEAERWVREALRTRPDDFDALHLLGVLTLDQKRTDAAIEALTHAATLRPDIAKVQFNLANALTAAGRDAEAEQRFRAALAIAPAWHDALNNLANTLDRLGRLEEAVPLWRAAIDQRADFVLPRFNLARALIRLDQPAAAIDALHKLLLQGGTTMEPARQADIHANLGDALVQLARFDDALEECTKTRRFDPCMADWNEGLLHLLRGNYARGWALYEQRFGVADHDQPRPDQTVIDLNSVAGKRVLLLSEQGRGDVIQFARYAPLLAAWGARVVVRTYANLQPLLATLEGVEAVMAEDEPEPDYDLATPLLSLPLAFGTTVETVPAATPYLHVPPDYAARWRDRLGSRIRPRIGLAWSGAAVHGGDRRRSMALATLAPLLRLDAYEFHAVQTDVRPSDRAWWDANARLRDHGDALKDFADSAALVAELDLVIAVDTSAAHLAGALGRPVWLMIAQAPDWRWMLDREDSPWYPTARLFRQRRAGDWADVVARIVAALGSVP